MADVNLDAVGLKQTLKDLFAGAAGGIAQVLLGQPFDIVKVRLQTTSRYSGALDGATQIFKNEGPAAFYKVAKFVHAFLDIWTDHYEGDFDAIDRYWGLFQFGGFHYARRQFEHQNAAKNPLNPTLSYGQYYLSGAFAGIANSVISGPIEHVRIRLQTQPHGAGRLYSGPIDCVKKLSAHEGVLAGLYRGEAVTIIREAQAYGAWFLTYELLMNADAKRNNVKRDEISQVKVAAYGGLAGEVLWLSSYPFDVVKSKMQSDGFGPNKKYSSMRDCFAQTWRLEGARGFWKGIGPTLLRAMPVSAGTFAVAEMAMRAMK